MSWTGKPKRNGNDELPTDRAAVKIIRTARSVRSPNSRQDNCSPTKQPVTKVAKLVYEAKRQPTSAVVKSIHSYRVPQNSGKTRENQNSVRPKGQSLQIAKKMDPAPTREEDASKEAFHSPDLSAFIEKRLERQKEVDEIHGILRGLSDERGEESNEPAAPSTGHTASSNMEAAEPQTSKTNTETIRTRGSSTKRSKTDPELIGRGRSKGSSSTTNSNHRTNGKATARSKSSTRTKSQRTDASSNVVSNPTPKQRSYDPQKARQFMQDQRERRKAMTVDTKKVISQVEREEIKKRLESLRKNTLAILQKNVKKARRKSVDIKTSRSNDPSPSEVISQASTRPPDQMLSNHESAPLNPPQTASIRQQTTRRNCGPSGENQAENLPLKTNNQQSRALQPSDGNVRPVSTPADVKKVGLLRKMDSDFNFPVDSLEPFDLGMDKENKFNVPTPRSQKTKAQVQKQSSPLVLSAHSSTHEPLEDLNKPLHDLELKVPNMKLKSRPKVAEKCIQVEPPEPEKPTLPYWLQPTPVQLYPYNFIKAVRKKLEAITNPVQTTKEEKTEIVKQPEPKEVKKYIPPHSLSLPSAARQRLLSRPDLNEVSSINAEQGPGHKLSTASSVFTPFLNSPINSPNKNLTFSPRKSPDSGPPPPPPAPDQSKSLSELTSSVTLNIPQSNTVSEVSSIHSEVMRQPFPTSTRISRRSRRAAKKHEDDTTASSSVFSSPEKRPPVPKKPLEMPLNSPNNQQAPEKIKDKSETFNISPLSTDKINNLNLKPKSGTESSAEVKSREEFEQMLQDFNKSLSHVIEVNQQLQSALSKTPRSASSRSIAENIGSEESRQTLRTNRKGSSSKSDNYSSDFEEGGSVKTEKSGTLDVVEVDSKSRHTQSLPSVKESSSQTVETMTSKTSTSKTAKEEIYSTQDQSDNRIGSAQPSPSKASFNEVIKNASTYTEDFHDSIEEASKTYQKFVSSPGQHGLLQDSNNFSKDSLELEKYADPDAWRRQPSREDIIRNQINMTRGDQDPARQDNMHQIVNRQSDSRILISDDSVSHRPVLNSSMGSDIFAIFNQSEMELSIISQSSRLSETHLNYSSLGWYEQLIKTEATKTEHLTALLKIREKSILDRTRGQIALLEIQKEKCKAKGLTVQISIIKRKQRAILMKMEKEREEIKRILRLSEKDTKDKQNTSTCAPKIPEFTISTNLSLRKKVIPADQLESRGLIRGYELNTSQNLEMILREREEELQRRRKHVERLLEWHQRLDQEEEEVLKIEQLLYKCNQQKRTHPVDEVKTAKERKKHKKLMDIDKSLRELQSITTNSGNESGNRESIQNEYIRTSGRKLNKLWRRLTGRTEARFDEVKKYKLSKGDLEKLYEDAKQAVLADFQKNDAIEILTDQSKLNESETSSAKASKPADIPKLNLNFSSGTSDSEQVPTRKSAENITFITTANTNENTTNESDASDNQSTDQKSNNKDTEYTLNFSLSEDLSSKELDTSSSAPKTKSSTTSPKDDVTVITHSPNSHSPVNGNSEADISPDYTPPGTETVTESFEYSQQKSSTSPKTGTKDSGQSEKVQKEVNYDELSITETVLSQSTETISEQVAQSLALFNGHTALSSYYNISLDKDNDSETMIEDISIPRFESTGEDTRSIAEEFVPEDVGNKVDDFQFETQEQLDNIAEDEEDRPPSELERRLIDLDESLKGLSCSFERALSPEINTTSPRNTIPNQFAGEDDKENRPQDSPATKMTVKDYLLNPEATSGLMPDIINEVELRRRQQILVESDIIQLENAVPYALLREIPNKPPPPYVPPAHGSPMTTIFPSEARIKEITFRRTKELYEEIIGRADTPEKQESILDENITNIYERIILDICKECVRDYQPTFTANMVLVDNYKMPLALFNPPNRLKCIQEFVYKRVRKLLSMDKQQPRQNSIFSLGRRKRDHVDEILIQELFEEEHKWTNFDLEEAEVRDSVVDEVFNELVKELIDDFEENCKWKKQKENNE